MDRWQYLIVLGACLLITAPLEAFGSGVYRQPRRVAAAVLPVAAVFLIWDAIAVAAHVWSYNPRYILGLISRGSAAGGGAVLPGDSGLRVAHLLGGGLPAVGAPGSSREGETVSGIGYTLPAVLAVVAVCALELGVLRTGLFRRPAYWISMVIVIGFQILVDGWLTKLNAPIVIYDDQHTSGIRFPFDIPVEDFLFGFALVTAVLLLWERSRPRREMSEQR